MRTDLFDFDLPEERIALHPVSPRDAARLLVVVPGGELSATRREARRCSSPLEGESDPAALEDYLVRDLPDLLRPGDALVMNDTRVIPAALRGVRTRGDAQASIAITLIERLDDGRWRALARPAKRLALGETIRFGAEGRVCLAGELAAAVAAKGEAGEVELAFTLSGAYLDEAIAVLGQMPLPPYIAGKRPPDDRDRENYQTVFATRDGAVAAPTAGLHLTPELLARLDARGISRHFVTLHVGAGTFLPVKAQDTAHHKMHAEWGEVPPAAAAALNEARSKGGRIVAVGTTTLRLLESAADEDGAIRPFKGATDIFITPGHRFRAVDLLMTNFHLPRSTLFMLAAAFSGLEAIKDAYSHAVQSGYRFYSYGDASLLFPGGLNADSERDPD